MVFSAIYALRNQMLTLSISLIDCANMASSKVWLAAKPASRPLFACRGVMAKGLAPIALGLWAKRSIICNLDLATCKGEPSLDASLLGLF